MFLRAKIRWKDGKQHRYFSIVENRRVARGRVVQRHVLYLGEINGQQEAAWCNAIEVFEHGTSRAKPMALFPEGCPLPVLSCEAVQIRLNQIQLTRPRQWGACWLVMTLWDQLRLDDFWSLRLPASRKGTDWVLQLPKSDADRKTNGFCFTLHKDKLREARRREGTYLLRSNLAHDNPVQLWP